MRAVINRCGLIAGPWQMGKSDQGVVTLWVAAHYFGARSAISASAAPASRCAISCTSTICAISSRIRSRGSTRYAGRMFNAGGGLRHSASLLELTEACEKATGNRISIGSEPENRPADIRIYITDHRRLTRGDRLAPRRDVPTVVGDISAWIRSEEGGDPPASGKIEAWTESS